MKTIKALWMFYSIIGILILLAVFALPTQTVLSHTPTCYSINQFGRECLMCGSTRSFLLAGHGKFNGALKMNRLAFILFWIVLLNSVVFAYFSVTNSNTRKS